MKYFPLVLALLITAPLSLFSQSSTEHWKNGVHKFNNQNYNAAIQSFRNYDQLEPSKSNAQFYLANSYYHLSVLDSAIFFYKKTLELHNSKRPNEKAMTQLSRCYLQKKDFENAYLSAFENLKTDLNNQLFVLEFRDICLWAYLIKYHQLSETYLTNNSKQPSYIVNSVAAQKIIARNIRNKEGFIFEQDKRKNVGFAQRWYGTFKNEKEVQSIHFLFINPDVVSNLEKQEKKALEVLVDPSLPVYERLGAFYFLAPFDNKKMDIALQAEDLIFRFCACSEIRSYISKRLKKKCLMDSRELIQIVVQSNPAFIK